MTKSISIVTIAFNDITGLERTAKSVLSQTTKPSKWIVIDGGSTDGSQSYLSSLTPECTFISESDAGIYDAMRKGLNLVETEYIIFLNSGDTLATINSISEFHQIENESDVYFFDTNLVLGNHRIRRVARDFNSTKYSVPAVQQSTIYRTTILKAIDWPTRFRICGDYYIAAQLYGLRARARSVNVLFSEFQLGGISTLRPLTLCIEAWKIQRGTLRLSSIFCAAMFLRRLVTTAIVKILYILRRQLGATLRS